MAVEHSTLTTTDLHEPKGVAAANADELYIPNGSGSGAWTAADNNIYLQGTIADISTAGSSWIVSPCAGTITNIRTIINGAISGGAITIANASSAAGDVDASTPTDNRVLAAGNKLEAITNGGSTNTIIAEVMYTITPL